MFTGITQIMKSKSESDQPGASPSMPGLCSQALLVKQLGNKRSLNPQLQSTFKISIDGTMTKILRCGNLISLLLQQYSNSGEREVLWRYKKINAATLRNVGTMFLPCIYTVTVYHPSFKSVLKINSLTIYIQFTRGCMTLKWCVLTL